jgi:hypothetical protein
MEVSFHRVNSNKFAKILEKLAKVRIHQFGNKNPGLDKPLPPKSSSMLDDPHGFHLRTSGFEPKSTLLKSQGPNHHQGFFSFKFGKLGGLAILQKWT